MIAINYTSTSNRSEFAYDSLSRRVKIVEKDGATVTSTKNFVWTGNTIAEERDATNNVAKRYYAKGFQSSILEVRELVLADLEQAQR